MLSRRCFRLLATRRVLQHRHLTVASTRDAETSVQKEDEEEIGEVIPTASHIDFRKNRSDLMRNTVWVGWLKRDPVNIAHVLSVVRYMEKRCGAIRDFLVIRDTEIPTKYINWIYITFTSKDYVSQNFEPWKESRYRIPFDVNACSDTPERIPLSEVISLVAPSSGPVTEPPSQWPSVADQLLEGGEYPNFIDIVVRRCTIGDFSEIGHSPGSRREQVRRYIMTPKTYHDLAGSFLAFKGFHPSSSTFGANRPMDKCVQKYMNHLKLEQSYGWKEGDTAARVSVDWDTSGEQVDRIDDLNASRSGPVVQLTKRNPDNS